MRSLTTLLGVAALTLGVVQHVMGHMQMYSPISRGDIRNKEYKVPSTKISAPLNGRKNPGKFPCRYQEEGPITAQYTAGKNFTVEFMQGSPHMGGHCQFAVSYDNGKNWVVLRTIISMCFEGKAPYQYSVALPQGARNGRALFGWTFINAGGNVEYYMNCADIEISEGNEQGSLTGPELLVARLPGTIDMPRWANRDATKLDGRKHFADRKIVTIPVGAEKSDDGMVVGEWGGGKEGVEKPPAVIPWKNFIASKFVSYAKGSQMIDDLGEFGEWKTFYVATSDHPRGCPGGDKGKSCPSPPASGNKKSTAKPSNNNDSYGTMDEEGEKESKTQTDKKDSYGDSMGEPEKTPGKNNKGSKGEKSDKQEKSDGAYSEGTTEKPPNKKHSKPAKSSDNEY